ncbi:zonular occludens toxin domain-containing protein [Xylophilus ampelinus]|uniref:Zona occludens toxin n=1 Tax=Xylophilus ampelinus TaxID=54067 RepID=A0A318SDG7_9BURK|nr:zonular occludens toxin domain-containing protein [Xylophilus ampelinus]MCS4511933.1 zonular occludens toxin domain-containing protein [Xylophilus ampelinus]PYE72693.1 zona occludens toxin [Xylophilus ampelinus]
MITIITGTPGAGKTLYAIDKLLRNMVGTTIKRKIDGVEVEEPRIIYSNINGLLLDHELIDDSDHGGLHNWHEWAKPGALIVYDEFQKAWPPRPNGSKVPPDIQALDTHRHMGVDFILITQSVMNTDRHIHALCNRHLHVRRMGNLGLTIVYEWDHASRTLLYSKALAKHPFKYSKSVFELYKSAEVHTKQPKSIPPLIWVALLALAGAAYLGPTVYGRLKARINGTPPAATSSTPARTTTVTNPDGTTTTKTTLTSTVPPARQAGQRPPAQDMHALNNWIPRQVDKPETAPVYDHLREVVAVPRIAYTICIDDSCKCFTQQKTVAEISPAACRAYIEHRPFDATKPDAPTVVVSSDRRDVDHQARPPVDEQGRM